MTTALTAAILWIPASLVVALVIGAAMTIADTLDRARDCCPHDVDVPDTVPAEWVTA
jgi:hypothetical protein